MIFVDSPRGCACQVDLAKGNKKKKRSDRWKIGKAFVPLTGLICALQSADFLR